MTTEWIVRQYREGDEFQINRMRDKIAGWGINESLDLEFWKWRYKKNPAKSSLIFVAEHQNKLVGHYGILPTRMLISGNDVLGSRADDGIIDPEYRGQGIYQELIDEGCATAEKEGISCIYGIPNKPSLLCHLKLGWELLCNVTLLVKILNKKKINTFTNYNHRQIFLKIGLIFIDLIKNPQSHLSDNKIKIKKVTLFDQRVDDLWERYSNQYDLIAERKMDYLNWRYVSDPILRNTIYLAEKDDKLSGYIVVGEGELSSSDKKDFKFGYILDLFCDLSSKKVLSNLISTAIGHFKESGVDAIKCRMLKDTKYYKMLSKYGFFKYGQKPFILMSTSQNYSIDSEKIKKRKRMHITFGDGF